MFRLGYAVEPWLDAQNRLTVSVQLNHPNDNAENICRGAEYAYDRMFFVRVGVKRTVGESLLGASTSSAEDFAAGAGVSDPARDNDRFSRLCVCKLQRPRRGQSNNRCHHLLTNDEILFSGRNIFHLCSTRRVSNAVRYQRFAVDVQLPFYRRHIVYTDGGLEGFNKPNGILYGRDQLFYVLDTYNNRIVMLNQAGSELSELGYCSLSPLPRIPGSI